MIKEWFRVNEVAGLSGMPAKTEDVWELALVEGWAVRVSELTAQINFYSLPWRTQMHLAAKEASANPSGAGLGSLSNACGMAIGQLNRFYEGTASAEETTEILARLSDMFKAHTSRVAEQQGGSHD